MTNEYGWHIVYYIVPYSIPHAGSFYPQNSAGVGAFSVFSLDGRPFGMISGKDGIGMDRRVLGVCIVYLDVIPMNLMALASSFSLWSSMTSVILCHCSSSALSIHSVAKSARHIYRSHLVVNVQLCFKLYKKVPYSRAKRLLHPSFIYPLLQVKITSRLRHTQHKTTTPRNRNHG